MSNKILISDRRTGEINVYTLGHIEIRPPSFRFCPPHMTSTAWCCLVAAA